MVCGPVQSDKAGLSYSTMAKSDWWFILSIFVSFPTWYVWDTIHLKPQKFGMGYYSAQLWSSSTGDRDLLQQVLQPELEWEKVQVAKVNLVAVRCGESAVTFRPRVRCFSSMIMVCCRHMSFYFGQRIFGQRVLFLLLLLVVVVVVWQRPCSSFCCNEMMRYNIP